jgi:ribosome-binding factor A
MESTRQNKVARLLQKDLGDIFQRLEREILQGKMITITVVRMSPDLSVAKVFLSVFPSDNKETFIEHLQPYTKMIRNQLAQKVRNQLRVVPELAFFIDDSLDYVEKIDQLLKK